MGNQPADAELRARLTPEQYHNTRAGMYLCVVCGENLVSSAARYDSGSGWPSFWQPVAALDFKPGPGS